MRDAVYVRVSDPRDPDAPSLDSQEASCRAESARSGGHVESVFRETQTGIEFWQRPSLQQLITRAQGGAFDRILFHSIDRMSRDPEHLTAVKVMLAMGGAAMVCVTEPIPDDDTGILVSFVRGWASKREWTQIRERTMRGRKARLERGMIQNAGRDLYGYTRDKELGVRIIVESEASIVRRMFAWVVEDRLSVRAIVRRLNGENVPSPLARHGERSAARWGPSGVRRLLRNPAYKGETIGWQLQSHDGGRRMWTIRPESDWVRLPEHVTPVIVQPAIWDAAQTILDNNRGDVTRNQERPYLLRGMMTCAVCGRRLRTETSRGVRYYRCGSRDTPTGACGARMVPADAVEQWMWHTASRRIADAAVIASGVATRKQRSTATLEREQAALEVRLTTIQRGQDRLLARFRESDSVSWELIERQIELSESERRQVQSRLDEIAGRISAIADNQQRTRDLREWCELAAHNLSRLDFDGKRFAMETIGARVVAAGKDPSTWLYDDDL